jgi:putative membrane protein
MIKILIRILVIAAALLLISNLGIGIVVAGFYTALVVAVAWGLITLIVKPVLSLLTLPINIITLGLFSFVLNALLFWFLSSLIKGFYVGGFIPALEGSLILMIVGWVLHLAL